MWAPFFYFYVFMVFTAGRCGVWSRSHVEGTNVKRNESSSVFAVPARIYGYHYARVPRKLLPPLKFILSTALST